MPLDEFAVHGLYTSLRGEDYRELRFFFKAPCPVFQHFMECGMNNEELGVRNFERAKKPCRKTACKTGSARVFSGVLSA
jgi:hypothetical protein